MKYLFEFVIIKVGIGLFKFLKGAFFMCIDKSKCKTKNRLLSSASVMFAEKGYFNTSVNDICQDAEANISAVNYHFRDKKGLYDAVLEMGIGRLHQELEEIFNNNIEESPESVVKAFIRYHLEIGLSSKSHIVFNKLRLRHMVDAENIGLSNRVQEKIEGLASFVRKIIRLFFPEDVPDHIVNLLQYTLVSQCLMPGMNPYFKNYFIKASGSPEKALNVFTEHILNVFMNAIEHYRTEHSF